jgi:UDP-N-acetylmuramyl pentapeptide phosphotransferase/UDP-N-acetylglucosamine-1-phosphate transferase
MYPVRNPQSAFPYIATIGGLALFSSIGLYSLYDNIKTKDSTSGLIALIFGFAALGAGIELYSKIKHRKRERFLWQRNKEMWENREYLAKFLKDGEPPRKHVEIKVIK